MTPRLKPLKFVGSSLQDLRSFPTAVRQAIGVELMVVQLGGMPSDFKPMSTVGAGAYEIRVSVGGAWRTIYVARLSDAVYVLHTFQKKTRSTSKSDLDLAARRYKQVGVPS